MDSTLIFKINIYGSSYSQLCDFKEQVQVLILRFPNERNPEKVFALIDWYYHYKHMG